MDLSTTRLSQEFNSGYLQSVNYNTENYYDQIYTRMFLSNLSGYQVSFLLYKQSIYENINIDEFSNLLGKHWLKQTEKFLLVFRLMELYI